MSRPKKHRIIDIHSFRFKIFLGINIAVFISFMLFSVFFLQKLMNLSLNQAIDNSEAYSARVSKMIENTTQAVRNDVDIAALAPEVTNILTSDHSRDERNTAKWVSDYYKIFQYIEKSYANNNVHSMYIVTTNDFAKHFTSNKFYPLSRFRGSKWYDQVEMSKGSMLFTNGNSFSGVFDASDDYIWFTRKLPIRYSKYETYFIGNIKKRIFNSLLALDNNVPFCYCALLNESGNILTDVPDRYKAVFNYVYKNVYASSDYSMTMIKPYGNIYWAVKADIYNTDMKFLYILDFEAMRKNTIKDSLKSVLLFFLLLLPVTTFVSYLLSRSLSKRISALKNNMLIVSSGNFNLPVLAGDGDDEISVLNRHFNYMATKIAQLMDEQYANGKRIKELELISLQAQINPHFLYNTLDLIKWKAIRNKDKDTEELIDALSGYYRLSLAKGKDMVPLKSELDHITAYVFIQNKRFDNGIRLHKDVPEKYLDHPVPKLILQPIVENAIMHGILELPDSEGDIWINASEDTTFLTVTVHDNGVGIPADTRMLCDDKGNEGNTEAKSVVIKSGYGLKNIDARIKLAFGNDYGLSVDTEVTEGTTIKLSFPANTSDKEENNV